MVPPRLPPGDHGLTLRSRLCQDGALPTSSVAVALDEVESDSGTVRSRVEVPFDVPEAVTNFAGPRT